MSIIAAKKTEKSLQNYNYDLLFYAGIVSLGLSYLSLLYQQPFNIDGILYLKTAAIFIEKGLPAAITTYAWPFYSMLIAWISLLSTLSLENSAFLLDALLIAINVIAFIVLVKELGGSRQTQYWAALVILIYPYLYHDQINILRDFGYYAFALVSLIFFIRFLRQLQWRYALAWNITLVLATLFRIEGAILLGLAPLAVFMLCKQNFMHRVWYFLQLNTINIIILLAVFLWQLKKATLSTHNAGRLAELITMFHSGISLLTSNLDLKNNLLKSQILNPLSADQSFYFLLGGLVSMLLVTIINTITLLYGLLSYYGFRYKLLLQEHAATIAVVTYIIINLIIVGVFLGQTFFLSGRYAELLCLLFMLAAPFTIDHFFVQKSKWPFAIIALWLVATAINCFGQFGTSKTYVLQAGHWITQNTSLQARVYSNDPQLAYYSHHPGTEYPQDFVSKDDIIKDLHALNLARYDYIAVIVGRNDNTTADKISALLAVKPLQSFSNNRGDKALIYKLH